MITCGTKHNINIFSHIWYPTDKYQLESRLILFEEDDVTGTIFPKKLRRERTENPNKLAFDKKVITFVDSISIT